jgi:hypothetical protein
MDLSKIWKDETVYIVGGGPSLRGFDWNRLRGKKVIAINKAFLYMPFADVLYWTDDQFYQWFSDGIEAFHGLKVTCMRQRVGENIIRLHGCSGYGINIEPGYINSGNNSGYGALNLAIKLGAKKIYLLGYDLHSEPGSTHWHDGYNNVHNHGIYTRLKWYFLNAIDDLKKMKVEVFNANPDSHLVCFPTCTLDSAIKDQPRSKSNRLSMDIERKQTQTMKFQGHSISI